MNTDIRLSGVLLHPTSFPSPYGIGELGDEAYQFIDFLESAGQRIWQILPLTHTGYGDSPYQSFSAFAGQPLLISISHLIELGLLKEDEVADCPPFSTKQVEYGFVIPWKTAKLKLSYTRFPEMLKRDWVLRGAYEAFLAKSEHWIDDYALFMSIKDANGGISWLEWDDEYRVPTEAFKEKLKVRLADSIGYYKYIQFMFFYEWEKLKYYANAHNVKIIGDIPIFVSMDSADVWANPHLFRLDSKGYPLSVAGVPPDYFSATGQLWGNPHYDWEAHKKDHFAWWISRIRTQLKNVDILRIDHFRGFEACWSIPYGDTDATGGKWIKSPGYELFERVQEVLGDDLPIIAEDLGIITPEVDALREHFHFPGMKVLQFAFEGTGESSYLPHQFKNPTCVCYTGTHDNNTTIGWYDGLRTDCREKLLKYLRCTAAAKINWELIALALSSTAAFAIYPLQDVLSVGSEGRMNTPGKAAGNWSYRYEKGALLPEIAKELSDLSKLYGRY